MRTLKQITYILRRTYHDSFNSAEVMSETEFSQEGKNPSSGSVNSTRDQPHFVVLSDPVSGEFRIIC